MRQFFKFMLASMLGLVLVVFILFFVLAGVIYSASRSQEVTVEPRSILKLTLNEEMSDRSVEFFDSENYRIKARTGLVDVLKDIHSAKSDPNITGIYLDLSLVSMGYASVEEIRDALLNFKKSGKFVYAYSEAISEKSYYLASAASKIFLNPQGILEFNGLSSEYTFFKGTLDKLGIEPQIFRVGKFKSFVEPFTLTQMSDANREQIKSYLGSLYQHYMTNIAASRNIPLDTLKTISSELKVQDASDALRLHLVDQLAYKDEVLEVLRKASGAATTKEIEIVSPGNYAKTITTKNHGPGKIAIVYASGDIGPGEGDDNSIGSERISRAIRSIRNDERVKALVLRVNSPGGSAQASEVIWREVLLTQKKKPVIVSMGDVAASGGYYISCAASKIVAEPNTITGSIGIFSIIPNAQRFFNDKLGITFDRVNTGKFSDIVTISRPLSTMERSIVQNSVNRGYQTFLKRVAGGRKKSVAAIDSIAQGRVYTGTQALAIGLVDKIGSFDDAVREAAAQAHLSSYTVTAYPAQKTFLESLLGGSADRVNSYYMKKDLGGLGVFGSSASELQSAASAFKTLQNMSGLQARLPFDPRIQ